MKYTFCPPRPSCGCAPPPCPDPCRPPCPPVPCPPAPCPPDPCCPQRIPCGRPEPHRPCGPRSYLLPRVVGRGREWQRRCQLLLTVDGLPVSLEPPFTLLSVSAAEPEQQELLPSPSPARQLVHLVLPLLCQVRDRNGCIGAGRAYIEVDVCMHLGVPACECWRASLVVQPCVRLACMPCPSDTASFDACLEVLTEAYLVRWEQLAPGGKPSCACQELPLYPELHVE